MTELMSGHQDDSHLILNMHQRLVHIEQCVEQLNKSITQLSHHVMELNRLKHMALGAVSAGSILIGLLTMWLSYYG